jgi:CHAD domain-containing protein
MSTSLRSATAAVLPAVSAALPRRPPVPRLNAEMACDTVFRVLARRYLTDLTASHEATCRGNPTALHQMRIALTRLRTAMLFFAPMIDDPMRMRIKAELKWLNSQLGSVRDLDVAIERLGAASKARPQAISFYRTWNAKREEGHRQLARALRSTRYRRLIETMSGWVESGPWSIKRGKQAAQERAFPIAAFGTGRLKGWREKLLRKSRKLAKMDTKKRHRLRLLNKKLSYSIEFFEDLFADERFSRQQTALKHLRKAQRSLGQLNDDAQGHSLAAALQQNGAKAPLQFLSPKRERRLIRAAATAYRKLAEMKGFRG